MTTEFPLTTVIVVTATRMHLLVLGHQHHPSQTLGGKILSLTKSEPTLEDVFIELVGHGLEGK